jgi:hypothetical protein
MTVLGRNGPTAATTADSIRRAVELACRAPSVHNSQPWLWRIDGSRVELRADRSRQLRVSDPLGRNLMLSCGAALHHLQVAAAGLGRAASVNRFPDLEDGDLLAVVDMSEAVPATPEALEELEALRNRRTDRRRFTSWPVPEERLDHLASVAERWGARVLPLTGEAARATVERLVDEAMEVQSQDAALMEEQREWVARSAEDGVPASSLPQQVHPSERRDRFDRRVDVAPRRKPVEPSDGVLAICTSTDTPAAWLDAGETLSALWLRATRDGLSLVPLSQVIEVEDTRANLRSSAFYDMAQPQLLVRVGWQEITRSPQPDSPRRPLDDVVADRNEATSDQ